MNVEVYTLREDLSEWSNGWIYLNQTMEWSKKYIQSGIQSGAFHFGPTIKTWNLQRLS